MIWTIFVQNEIEELWKRLDNWQKNFELNITTEKYFKMCEEMGQEPNPDKIPPEIQDFPIDVQKAIHIFNKLGDRIVSDIGYLGKDYTQLPIYLEVYDIDNKKLVLETLLRLDSYIIKKSQEAIKNKRKKG